jgi:hypothetical protein
VPDNEMLLEGRYDSFKDYGMLKEGGLPSGPKRRRIWRKNKKGILP